VGHNIEEVDSSELGHITLPDDPKVGTLYKVTNPAFEDGEYSVNEIGVNARAKSVAICDASNKADKEQNPNALSMSEVTMNVWTEKSGGQSTTALETIYIKDCVEDSTYAVVIRGHSHFNTRWDWSIRADTTDPEAKAIFTLLTTDATAYGGAVNKMGRNWIGKQPTNLDVQGASITYHLG